MNNLDERRKVYILTGGTGFVGSLLSLKLIEEHNKIFFLGRSKNGVTFKERIIEKLKSIKSNVNLENVDFIEMDLQKDEESSNLSKIENVDAIWHLAANLSFKKKEKNEIFKTNINGLEKVIEIASRLKCPIYYMSTSYAHGWRLGLVYEKDLVPPKKFNNPYEESKFRAEEIIREYHKKKGIDFIVFRPSILIDKDSRNITFFGYYVILFSLLNLKNKLGSLCNKIIIPFFYYRGSRLNLMPIDLAIDWIARISKDSRSLNKTFHVTNPDPFLIKDIAKETFGAAGVKILRISVPKIFVKLYFRTLPLFGFLGKSIKDVVSRFDYFYYYIVEDNQYDMTNTKMIIGKKEIENISFSSSFIRETAQNFIKKINRK